MASVTRVASMTETRDTTGGEGLVPRRAPEAGPRRGLDRDTLQAIYDRAAPTVGPRGLIALLDLSAGMLAVARWKIAAARMAARIRLVRGDMSVPPLADASFDLVLSTCSLRPLSDPAQGALELYAC